MGTFFEFGTKTEVSLPWSAPFLRQGGCGGLGNGTMGASLPKHQRRDFTTSQLLVTIL